MYASANWIVRNEMKSIGKWHVGIFFQVFVESKNVQSKYDWIYENGVQEFASYPGVFFSSKVDERNISLFFLCSFIVRSCDDPIGRLQLKVAEHSFQEPMPNSP